MIDLNDAISQRAELVRYDLDDIVRRLRDSAQSWVPQHFPNGRREGDEWRLGNIRGNAPRKNGSCIIALKGEHAGDWYDHDGGEGGGPLNALEHATGFSGRELYALAAEIAGWTPASPARRDPPPPPQKEKDSTREIDIIMSRLEPVPGSLAETYLRSRSLAIPDCPDLKFHPDLTHWDTKTGFPALVGLVRISKEEIVALQRIYLSPDGMAKAPVTTPKKMLGKVAGGAVRLGTIGADGRLGLCEGIETGLAVMTAVPGLPVWATLSTSHLEQVVLPLKVREIVILADNDSSGAGGRAAEAIASKLSAEGRKVAIAMPPEPDTDFNDLLVSEGPEAVAALARAAFSDSSAAAPAEPEMGRHLPHGFTLPTSPLPRLRADEGDLSRAANRAWSLILASNKLPWIFRMGAQLVWVVPDDQGHLEARPMTDERLRYMLARLATWQRLNRHGDLVPAAPPTGIVKSLLATPDPALPVLGGIVSTPVFGANGALITSPGYHQETRLLYHPAPGFVLPPIAERPAAKDVEAARELLLADLLGDFPFVGDAERAHALSLLLLGFVRAMIDGPTPLHVIEKPERGTGAGLMIDVIATILTGSAVVVMTAATDEEEWRKRITAKLRQMPLLSVVDNINQEVDSAALAAALTAPFWEDRILGLSETTRLPIRCIWIATGNNPKFSREITRRIVRIRMDAGMENPHLRTDFRHPDLMGWVKANRARLVAACLTLIQSWVAAGRPMSTKRIGSFEAWARVIGGILENAGIAGFLGNLEDLMARSDGESAMWRGFVSQWWNRYGTAEVGTSDLYEAANTCEPPLPLGTGSDHSQRIRLGRMLGRLRDRVFEIEGRNVRVTTARVSHQAQRWLLQLQDPPAVTRSGSGNVGNVQSDTSINIPLKNTNQTNAPGNVGNMGNVFARLRTCADACAPACEKEGGEKYSPSSPHSPNAKISMGSRGECRGEYSEWHSPTTLPPGEVPDWLKEVL